MGAVCAVITLGAIIFSSGGWRLFRAGLPALLLLCVAIPPPFELDRSLILWLQAWTAQWGSQVLDLLGIYHVLAGHVVEINGRQYLVEEACSGVNSLFSVIAITLLYVLMVRRPIWHGCCLLITAVVWVLAANVARVVVIVYMGTTYGIDIGNGWLHEALGLGMFAIVLGLVWSTDRLAIFLTAPSTSGVPEPSRQADVVDPTQWSGISPIVALPVALVFALFACLHLGLNGGQADSELATATRAVQPEKLVPSSLPTKFGHWSQKDFATNHRNPGSEYGESSTTWIYEIDGHTATLSLDYTFPAWHDLTRCYTSQGWVLGDQAVHTTPAEFVEVDLAKPAYRSGYLVFTEFDLQGDLLEARKGGSLLSLYRHDSVLQRWFGEAKKPKRNPTVGPVFQLQVFVETNTPLTARGKLETQSLFMEALRVIRSQAAASDPEAEPRTSQNAGR
jgi:exosortase